MAAMAGLSPGRAASRTRSAAASSGGSTPRLIVLTSSRADSRLRLVTRTMLPPVPGSRGCTCSLSVASSRTRSSRLPATRSRHSPALASSPAGICAAGTPITSSRLASASAGLTGWCPGVGPCSSRKIRPPGKRPASRCAAWTANAVLPTPAIPSIANTAIIRADSAGLIAASSSSASSGRRPANESISRGSVPVPADIAPASARPRAAASNSILATPCRCSASASNRTVSLCGVATTPRSRSLTARELSPAASASSSCVSPAPARSPRSTPENWIGGSATAVSLARGGTAQ